MWRIFERLWLGDHRSGGAALSGVKQPVEEGGEPEPFSGVVSLCPMPYYPEDPLELPLDERTEWLLAPIADGGKGGEEFNAVLDLAFPFIELRRGQGNVMVHCAAGMSRSVSLLAAWLCQTEGVDSETAFERVAQAKARAVGPDTRGVGYGPNPEDLIAPAADFRDALGRRFPPAP